MSVLKVGFFADHPEAKVPTIAYGDDAGYDLYSAETITIMPHTCEGVNCKFMIDIPWGIMQKFIPGLDWLNVNLLLQKLVLLIQVICHTYLFFYLITGNLFSMLCQETKLLSLFL